MDKPSYLKLSRRERQIMDVLYQKGQATAAEIRSAITDPPSYSAVRAKLSIMEEKGYVGASMLAVAKKAKASNETLYNWYGDKRGLFQALVLRNAEDVKTYLEAELATDHDAQTILAALGPKLLGLLPRNGSPQCDGESPKISIKGIASFNGELMSI